MLEVARCRDVLLVQFLVQLWLLEDDLLRPLAVKVDSLRPLLLVEEVLHALQHTHGFCLAAQEWNRG